MPYEPRNVIPGEIWPVIATSADPIKVFRYPARSRQPTSSVAHNPPSNRAALYMYRVAIEWERERERERERLTEYNEQRWRPSYARWSSRRTSACGTTARKADGDARRCRRDRRPRCAARDSGSPLTKWTLQFSERGGWGDGSGAFEGDESPNVNCGVRWIFFFFFFFLWNWHSL